jgi:hypothetical protein
MAQTRRWLAVTATAATCAVVSVAAPSSAAPAPPRHVGIGVRLLDAPSKLIRDPRAHAYIIDSLAPGSSITRHIAATNDTGHAAHVLFYADAASIANGRFAPAQGKTTNELTSWVSVTPTAADMPQGATVKLTVVVRVPAATTIGERYAAVLADVPPTSSGPGVKVESRAGIRMYVNVGVGVPQVNFTIDTLTAERDATGRPVVQAQVHNTGKRAIDLSGTLGLDHGPGGLSAGPFAAQLGTTLAPGQSEPVTVKLDKALPAGPWHARIDLRSGLIERAAEGTITFPSAAGTAAAPVRAKPVPFAKNRNLLVPVALGLIALALIGFILLALLRRRRKDEEDDAHHQEGRTSPRVPGQRRGTDEQEQVHR